MINMFEVIFLIKWRRPAAYHWRCKSTTKHFFIERIKW